MKRWLVALVVLLSMVGTAQGMALPWSTYSDAAKDTVQAREVMCEGGPVFNAILSQDGTKYWQMFASDKRVLFIYQGDDDLKADVHLGIVDPKHTDRIIIREVTGSADVMARFPSPCDYLFPKTV